MTCLCPSPALQFSTVPELKTLARHSYSQSFCKNKLNTNASFVIKSFQNDYMDNNEEEINKSEALCDIPPMISNMKVEANRLKSFENGWPLSFIKPKDCASVGLYYLGEGDRVKCAFCTGIITSWEEGDKPLVEHVKHFPMCPYLLNRNVGNVPISGLNGSQPWQISNAHAERTVPSGSNARQVQPTLRTKYSSMACLDKRLQTFHNWLSNTTSTEVTPLDLAEAGFFYTGVADVVTCYCCGGQVGGWDYGDNAWVEHAKHYPTCLYVKSIKGSAFIEVARLEYLSEDSARGVAAHSASASASSDESYMKSYDVNMPQKAIQITENTPAKDDEKQFMCKICMNLGTRVAFIPCGHSLTCPNCAKELRLCPMCRSKIQSVVRLYFD